MRGIAYGVGVGPGDPELMTLKACRMIRENNVFAFPGKDPKETVAYQIAVQAVPELAEKTLIPLYMPMTMNREERDAMHDKGAAEVEKWLDKGENVIFLTLGDSTVYCTFSYLQKRILRDGYDTALVPGITSFCATAARMNQPLCEWDEELHIVPARHALNHPLNQAGNYVLMKSGSKMTQVKEELTASGRSVLMVENCGMANEHIYNSVEEIPDDAGYYSLIIAREQAWLDSNK